MESQKLAVRNHNKLIGYFFRIMAVIIWGIAPIVIKYNLSGINPIMITGLSIHIGFLFILPLYILRKKTKQGNNSGGYTKYFWATILFDTLVWIFFIFSLHFTTASNPILFLNFAPVMALIVTIVFFPKRVAYLQRKGQRVYVFLIFAIGCFGTTLLVTQKASNFQEKLIGDLYGLIALVLDVAATMFLIHYAKSKEAFAGMDFIFRKIAILSLLFAPFVFANFSSLSTRIQ